MHIIMLGSRGIPASYGGVETAVENLAVKLVGMGHRVTVICMKHKIDDIKSFKGVEIVRLPAIKTKYFEMISHTLLAICYLFFKKYDILHIHSVEPTVFAVLLRFKSPIIATSHGLAYLRDKWGWFGKTFSKLAERVYIKSPCKCIAVSKKLCDLYKKKYGRDVKYIPNAIDIMTMNNNKSVNLYDMFGLQNNNYILFVGRIIPTKGVMTLIEAYGMLTTDIPLVIVGDASYTDEFFSSLKRKSSNKVMFLGYQTGEVLCSLYKNCRLIVFPSENEGLSLVLLEALSSLKPVIFSDIPENLEVALGLGLAFRAKNVVDLSNKMKKIIMNSNTYKVDFEEIKNRLQKNFSWDFVANEYLNIYSNELLKSKK